VLGYLAEDAAVRDLAPIASGSWRDRSVGA
jgi:hypothetical protein